MYNKKLHFTSLINKKFFEESLVMTFLGLHVYQSHFKEKLWINKKYLNLKAEI